MKDTLESLRHSIPVRVLNFGIGPHKYFPKPPKAKGIVVWATGGLGDVLLTIPVAEQIREFTGENVTLFTRFVDIAKELSDLDVQNEKDFMEVGRDWWITINTLVLFNFSPNFKGFENRKVLDLFLNYKSFLARKDWDYLVQHQPYMENITGIRAVEDGFDRQSLPFGILGLPFKPKRRSIRNPMRILNRPYITIHHGFDSANRGVRDHRSTKNWTVESWENLVYLLRGSHWWDYPIVQLGDRKCPKIRGADYVMTGKLSLLESLRVVSETSLHIDTEGGLVHAAQMFGRKSVVLFGPTNLDFFGYKENTNIPPRVCGNCWWLKHEWMERCSLGYLSPMCMDSITPEEVAKRVREALNGPV